MNIIATGKLIIICKMPKNIVTSSNGVRASPEAGRCFVSFFAYWLGLVRDVILLSGNRLAVSDNEEENPYPSTCFWASYRGHLNGSFVVDESVLSE
jgi:hypothetical protein